MEYLKSDKCPSAMIFDMDGVLFDSENEVLYCWQVIGKKYGIPHPEHYVRSCLGLNREASKAWFLEHYGDRFPYDQCKQEMSALFHERNSGGRLPVKAGVFDILKVLRDLEIPCAVASSTRREVVTRELSDGGLLPYFDFVVCGDMVSHSKPHLEIFLTAASLLGVAPSEAIVVEDSFNGIRAAHAGGFRPVMVPDQVQPNAEIAALTEKVFPSMRGLQEYIVRA